MPLAIYLELQALGFKASAIHSSARLHISLYLPCASRLLSAQVWYDNRADDLTKEGMLKGIEQAAAFVLFLSTGVLERPYCQMEIRHALVLEKPIVLLHGESGMSYCSIDTTRDARKPFVQSRTPGTAPSTSAPPMPLRPPTCRSSSISTSPCPSDGAGTSATGC